MNGTQALSRSDLGVLLWIIGCRTGASIDEIVTREQSHHRQPPTKEAIDDCLQRLVDAGLIVRDGNHYSPEPKLQTQFLNEIRNCRDTFEESDILRRILKLE